MRSSKPTLALALAAAAAAAAPAHAALVVDQSYLASPANVAGTPSMDGGAVRRVQTFTAGLTGALEQVRIQLNEPGDFVGLRVLATAVNPAAVIRDRPTQTVLATGTYRGRENGFAIFDLSLAVTAGQVLALDPIVAAGQFASLWVGTMGDPYARGNYFQSTDGGASYGAFAYDMGFQTLVRTADAAVPEPATWGLMLLGLGAAGAAMRRARGRVRGRVSFAAAAA